MKPQTLELLAPARDLETGRQAILHGADAVYIGAEGFGARSRAGNSVSDIGRLVRFAAPYGAKVYVTVNTIVYEDELPRVRDLIYRLYAVGVDALIVQDLGILRLDLPPVALHASTQCDTRTPAKARWLASLGFSQIVIARECSLAETADICRAVPGTPVEAFVHGALCVSYSGDCRASLVNTGRSANRGECAQMCRLKYTLVDGNGHRHPDRHYLSLKDMNRLDSLSAMVEAGVRSFKIEGRLKDAAYVKNITAAYRQALDAIIAANPDKYCRPSLGKSTISFTPDTGKSFNRGYTRYFLTDSDRSQRIGSPYTPKALGEQIGIVKNSSGKTVTLDTAPLLNNGDGLTYLTTDGQTGGFHLNRAEGNRLVTAQPLGLPPGTTVYRNHDRLWEEAMLRPTAKRLIPVSLTLRRLPDSKHIALSGTIAGVGTVTVSLAVETEDSQSPDNGYRLRTLSKTGDTIFSVTSLDDRMPGTFVRASDLTSLRRLLTDTMLSTLMCRHIPHRRKTTTPLPLPEGTVLTYSYNIANHLAADVYNEAGATGALPHALEVDTPPRGTTVRVMTCRHCLRRELGACLKQNGEKRLKSPLRLEAPGISYSLEFDCKNCRMNVLEPV